MDKKLEEGRKKYDKKYEISALSCEEAIELKQGFVINYYLKDFPWPLSQSIAIDRFVGWLYTSDYEIVKKGK